MARTPGGHADPACQGGGVSRTLVTGMSATGKSSTVLALRGRGHRAVDLDQPDWSHHVVDADGEQDWCWRLDAVRALLEGDDLPLVVSGTSSGQGTLYPLLDHVVLLTVPTQVAVARLATRTTNDYGKHPDELARELALRGEVEPLLRSGACLVLDTSVLDLDAVAAAVLAHADGPACPSAGARHP